MKIFDSFEAIVVHATLTTYPLPPLTRRLSDGAGWDEEYNVCLI